MSDDVYTTFRKTKDGLVEYRETTHKGIAKSHDWALQSSPEFVFLSCYPVRLISTYLEGDTALTLQGIGGFFFSPVTKH